MSLDNPSPGEAQSAVTILEAFAAFALIAGFLLALGETRLYPLALGILTIAILWTLIGHPAILTNIGHLFNAAGQITSGSSSPSPAGIAQYTQG